MTPTINQSKCAACGRCFDKCPERAITATDGMMRIDASRCVGCGLCALDCPCGAIEVGEGGESY